MRILGIDYGLKKIGLAIADTATKLPEPLEVIKVIGSKEKVIRKISFICENQRIEKIVVGLPESGLVDEIKQFGGKLAEVTRRVVIFYPETLTSKEAIDKMLKAGKRKKKREKYQDAVAAAIILENYLS